MISEIPVTEPLEESAEPLEPAEPEPLEPPPPPSPPKKEPEKRRPGRPKKEPKENVPPPDASDALVPKPQAKPKAKPKKPKDEPFKTLEAPSFTISDLSNGQLMAELVNRRRATDREMKANLYRSFVM